MDVAQVGIDQIDELEEKIDGYEKRNGEILQLYEHRRTWAPLLHRLSEPDVLPRNIWYSEIEFAKGKASRQQQAPEELVLSGYARGSSDDTNTSPMYQAIRVFAENLATDNTDFAEQFVGKPAKDDKGTELVDISPPKEAPANAPKKAVKFGRKLTVKPKKVVETKKRK